MDEVCFQERIPHKVEQQIEARSTYVRTHAQTYVRTYSYCHIPAGQ